MVTPLFQGLIHFFRNHLNCLDFLISFDETRYAQAHPHKHKSVRNLVF